MSKTTIEQEWTLTIEKGQRIVRVELNEDGHGLKYYTVPELETESILKTLSFEIGSEEFEEMFPIIAIEEVSWEKDRFLQYTPETDVEKRIKNSIMIAKEMEMKNFRIAAIDPSFAEDGETIVYCAGKEPARGKSAIWWDKNATKVMPEKNSRLMYEREKDVCLGMLIKDLVEKMGYKVRTAWKEVCSDSTELGHYLYSKDAHPGEYEQTGSRRVGRFFDLSNTTKIVKARGDEGYWLYAGNSSNSGTLSLAYRNKIWYPSDPCWTATGQLRFDV